MEQWKYPIVGAVALFFGFLPFFQSSETSLTPAQKMERVLSPVLPKSLGEGGAIKSAKAEGDTLVLTVEVPASPFTRDETSRMFAAGFCLNDRAEKFFRDGGKLRFDLAVDGSVEAGKAIESCPTRS